MIKVLTNISSVRRGQLIYNLIKNYLTNEKIELEKQNDAYVLVFEPNNTEVARAQTLLSEVGVKSRII